MKQVSLSLADNDLVADSVQSRPTMQSRIILYFLIFYISLPFIEAPLRYYLVEQDIPWAIYLRDILVVLIAFWFVFKSCIFFKHDKIILYLMGLLIFHSLIGLIYLPNEYMILFGWKTFLPILLGVGSYYVFIENLNKMRWVFLILFLISVAGIFINYFVDFPWEGFTYALDTFKIEASKKEDITFGIRRLSGFSRYFYEVATLILFLNIFLVAHFKNKFYRISIWLLGGLAIILTTVKGIFLSYLIISILLIFLETNRKMVEYYQVYRKLLLTLLLIAILLPIMTYLNLLTLDIGMHDEIKDMLFTSFTMRLYDTWPEAIEIMQDKGSLLLGRGLGGLGQSQIFFETYLFTPVDNIFIFLFGCFGVLGGLYLIYLYYKGRLLNIDAELYFCLLLLIIFQYGITQTVFESPLLCLSLGFLLAHVNNSQLRTEYQKQLNGLD